MLDEDRIFPQLEEMLADASRRQMAGFAGGEAVPDAPAGEPVPPQPRAARRTLRQRLAVRPPVLALAAVLTTGTALAATQPWQPLLGNDRQGHPTSTAQPVDARTVALLGVLRRPQDADDRGAGVQGDADSLGDQSHGVRVGAVRLLGRAPDGRAVVLVPVARFADDRAAPSGRPVADALCVYYPFVPRPGQAEGADFPCWTTAQIAAGQAIGRLATAGRQRAFGLAIDGAASVELVFSDGTSVRAPVSGNYFDVALPASAAKLGEAPTVRVLDAHGDAVVAPPSP